MELSEKLVVGFLLAFMVGCTVSPNNGKTSAVGNPPPAACASAIRIEAALTRMRQLGEMRKGKDLIDQFKNEDIAAWPPAFAAKASEACNLRGQAYVFEKDNERAEKDFNLALELSPSGYAWYTLGEFYQSMKDDQRAINAYTKAFEMAPEPGTGKSDGWIPLRATLNAASILLGQTMYQEALEILARYGESDIRKMPPVWAIRILRIYGRIYSSMGREEAALVNFKAALELEKKQEAEWKTPPGDPLPTPIGPWTFRADQTNQGVVEKWFAANANTTDWAPIEVPAFWANTGAVGDYQGYAWYRTTFTAPAAWKGRTVRLLFSAVDEEAWVYVNGKLIREHSARSEGRPIAELWEEAFTADIPPDDLNYGQANALVVRVNNTVAGGGIWRPVLGCAVDNE